MKLNELVGEFSIQTTNEEKEVLARMKDYPIPIISFPERERFVIEGLIRKALVSKITNNGSVMVIANESY
jgi:hypothetical protein